VPAGRAAILLLGLAAAAGASAKFEQYVPRTLQSVIDANRSALPLESTQGERSPRRRPVNDWSAEGIEVVIAASTERMLLHDPSG
jgi:hypothetical protein